MKRIIFTFFFTITILGLNAQFAPEGAIWYYGEAYAFSPNTGYMHFVAEGDTIIQGTTCQKIRKYGKVGCLGRPWMEFTYEDSATVYYYNPHHDAFEILYDFTAESGDSWTVYSYDYDGTDEDTISVIVDSVDVININGFDLKRMFVHYNGFSLLPFPGYEFSIPTILIERIGDLYYMFNFWPSTYQVCDGNGSTGLRCYEDLTLGLYDTGIAESCTYTGILEIDKNNRIKTYPNPVSEIVIIESDLAISIKKYIIRDLSGQIVQRGFISTNEIQLKHTNAGVYILEFYSNKDELLSLNKFVKFY